MTFLNGHFRTWGPLYVALTLLIISSHGIAYGVMGLLFFIYLTGYTSLEFQLRHVFQWAFVPVWAAGFLVDKLWPSVPRACRRLRHAGSTPVHGCLEGWRTPAWRALAFSVIALWILLVPLYVARAWQYASTERLLKEYQALRLTPLNMNVKSQDDQFAVVAPELPPFEFQPASPAILRTQYLAVDIDGNGGPIRFALRYDQPPSATPVLWERLEYSDTLPCVGTGDNATWRFFFPIYEFYGFTRGGPLGPFAGLAVAPWEAKRFKKFYRVENVRGLPILLNVLFPPDSDSFRRQETIQLVN